ncbi:hypothetical protein Tco_1291082, partial [Tanacetum coccineum]
MLVVAAIAVASCKSACFCGGVAAMGVVPAIVVGWWLLGGEGGEGEGGEGER